METLLKEKEKLEHKIDTIKSENTAKLRTMDNLKKKLDTLNIKIQYESSKIEELDIAIAEKQKSIKELENEVFKYESKKKEKLKDALEDEYRYYITKINKIKFANRNEYEKQFDLLKKIMTRCKRFKRLHIRLYDLYNNEQKEIMAYALSKVQKYDNKVQKIDALSKSIAYLVDLEIYFEQDVFANHVFENVYNGFSYNFLSSRKTNRLDKPEWFVDFLIDKLKNEQRKILIYQGLKDDNKFYDSFASKLEMVINQKVDEIVNSESDQKKDLLLHFVDEVSRLVGEFKRMFSYTLSFSHVKDIILQTEHKHIKACIKEIHLEDHERWFVGYQTLVTETFLAFKSLQAFDSALLPEAIGFIAKEMVMFYGILLKRLQFVTHEETYLVCYIFSEIEDLKMFIQSKQNELSSTNNIDIPIDLHPLSKLNNEVLKYAKTNTRDDMELCLKRVKNFVYIQEKLLVNTKLEITTALATYKKKMKRGYNIIENYLGDYVDNFFFDNILLKVKFNKAEFRRFKDFYGQIKSSFTVYSQWKTDIGVKCVNDILNGKEPMDRSLDSIFNILYNLYEEKYY